MTVQRLDRTLFAYRIGDPDGRYPIFDDVGSTIAPGRWNTPASPVIYTGEHYSTAMLEKLVYANGLMPPNPHFIEITIPAGTSQSARRQCRGEVCLGMSGYARNDLRSPPCRHVASC